jgi:RNA polymerase sigma-70 factor (ECF subfamily)
VSLDLDEQYDKIYRYCYFKTYNSQIAEDLTQETFLRYFSQKSYISHGKPLAYLYTIAKNLCIDHYRKIKEESLDEEILDNTENNSIETSIAIKQALSTLPKELQELILLRFVNELSIGEICDITSLSRFAVYRRIKDALKQLNLVLREEDFYE